VGPRNGGANYAEATFIHSELRGTTVQFIDTALDDPVKMLNQGSRQTGRLSHPVSREQGA
jgi:hypothetical protein